MAEGELADRTVRAYLALCSNELSGGEDTPLEVQSQQPQQAHPVAGSLALQPSQQQQQRKFSHVTLTKPVNMAKELPEAVKLTDAVVRSYLAHCSASCSQTSGGWFATSTEQIAKALDVRYSKVRAELIPEMKKADGKPLEHSIRRELVKDDRNGHWKSVSTYKCNIPIITKDYYHVWPDDIRKYGLKDAVLLGLISNKDDDDGVYTFSLPYLQDATRWDRRTVESHIKSLQTKGAVAEGTLSKDWSADGTLYYSVRLLRRAGDEAKNASLKISKKTENGPTRKTKTDHAEKQKRTNQGPKTDQFLETPRNPSEAPPKPLPAPHPFFAERQEGGLFPTLPKENEPLGEAEPSEAPGPAGTKTDQPEQAAGEAAIGANQREEGAC